MMFGLLILLIIGGLFLVPTVLGIVRAAQNGDTPWLIGILIGWIIGLGWVVAIVYLLGAGAPRRPGTMGGYPPPPPTTAPPNQPAAWHADPTGRFEQRYWDGTRWTHD